MIATKADKLSRMQQQKSRGVIASALGVGTANIIVTSAEKGIGKEDVFKRLDQLLQNAKSPDDGE